MKGRLFAGLLAIVLGFAGCGSGEAAETLATTANTTAATFETTTTAETTTKAAITETTPPQTTTVSETASPVIYNDDEQTLNNLITEKTGKELLLWEYGDFDNDGAFEAFAFPGEINEFDKKSGTLYLVNSIGLNIIQGETYGIDVFTFTFDEYTFAAMVYYGTMEYSRIWGVNGKEAYEPPISRIGQQFTVDENGEMTIIQSAFDNFTMGDDGIPNGAHTWKPYYFYYDNGFCEYGGSEISLEDLLTYENADTYIDEIENLNGEITNILRRENGIININYKVQNPNALYLKWNYYYTLKLSDEIVTHITDNPDKPEWDNGVYLPALLPEIAVYSDPETALAITTTTISELKELTNLDDIIKDIEKRNEHFEVVDTEKINLNNDNFDDVIVLSHTFTETLFSYYAYDGTAYTLLNDIEIIRAFNFDKQIFEFGSIPGLLEELTIKDFEYDGKTIKTIIFSRHFFFEQFNYIAEIEVDNDNKFLIKPILCFGIKVEDTAKETLYVPRYYEYIDGERAEITVSEFCLLTNDFLGDEFVFPTELHNTQLQLKLSN
jgi:hypothetical protein